MPSRVEVLELRLKQQSRVIGLKLPINLILFFVTFVIFVVNKNFQSVFINSFKVSIVLTLTKQYY
jgi:hypothetical protein